MNEQQQAFLADHVWAVLATGRRDGSPQQSMVGYAVDAEGRLVISTKAYAAKWHNAVRLPKVSVLVPDGRVQLVITGTAEAIDADPLRAELTADVFGVLSQGERPDPASILEMLDQQQRTVLRVTPETVHFNE